MKWSHVFLFVLAVAASTGRYVWSPFPPGSENPVVALMALDAPMLLWVIHGWYAAMPGVITFIGGTLVLGVWRVWFESTPRKKRGKGELPPWPISPSDEKPAIVVGETHHPVEPREVPNPDWLVIPERGLYTGIAIFGAVGSGKTSACMHPFARQLLGWQATNPKRRAAALILEVKGDFCYDIREILKKAGREDDYMELSMDGKWQWNPLAAHWLDAYSLAYTVSSLLNQLFGKGKDPFWQQAYTNLVKWIIELYRIFPDRWVTLRDVYQCAINPDLFKEKIDEAGVVVYVQLHGEIVISDKDWKAHKDALLAFGSWNELEDGECKASKTPALEKWLQTEGIPYRITVPKSHTKPKRLLARWQSVKTWYDHDWMKLDPKLRTSCVEGISSFLSLFDMEDVADIFCPQAPPVKDEAERPQWEPREEGGIWKHLPPLDELIESGKVLALNMPAGSNPALARAVGVFLKNAWLQTLLRRPAQMKADPKRYFRPAVFICDEYQSFASVGEDDPSGDEKAFALTRQCRVIPIVATQSISSLRSVLGTSEAWRALLQTLRTRIFLSLSDDASAELASKLCGQVAKIKPSWTVTESTRQAEVSLLSGKAGGGQGSVGTSKSFREQREALFQPREFALLPNCQAICLPYDGTHATSAVRVYLKPYYLPETMPYWRAVEAGKI